MTRPRCCIRRRMIIATLWLCCAACAWTQDSTPDSSSRPLGDIARKSRQERTDKDHIAAKKVLNEEGSSKPVLTVHACKQLPCSSLSISLPAPVAWTRAGYIPVPLPGHEDDKSHSIRVYEADILEAYDVESAKHLFLQDWFSRPYFFGQAAKFLFDESTRISGWPARITHFTVAGRVMNFRGLGLTAAVPTGTFGFACVFREEDSGDAAGICENILNSARIDVAEKYRLYGQPNDDP